MNKYYRYDNDECFLQVVGYDQHLDLADLKKHNIYYDGCGVVAIMLKDDMAYIGYEDDGTLYFNKGDKLHRGWLKSMEHCIKLARCGK